MRMPKMQVYLPDELYDAVKKLELPASGLLQDAVRSELQRRELIETAWEWVRETEATYGSPTELERAAARRWVERLTAER